MTPGDLSAEDLNTRRGWDIAGRLYRFWWRSPYAVAELRNMRRWYSTGQSSYRRIAGTLCPGDNLTDDQCFVVDAGDAPAVFEVDEGWYSASRGVVLRLTTNHYRLPLVRPYDLTTTVTRTVPRLTLRRTGSD